MPRQARIDTPGALHHVIARGIERRDIFLKDRDREDFVNRLGTILEKTGTQCFAWALIPNHFHLLLRTGLVPIATVMRRLLTGHAISFNRRHHRHGHVFQNRYKSILCQEDTYLLELVRYIHLNPLRAGLVRDMEELEAYPFCGHGVLLGRHTQSWQHIDELLSYFNTKVVSARQGYRAFVAKGIGQGQRPDLMGGGLIRSSGSWTEVQAMKKAKMFTKSDERILGDSAFVDEILSKSREAFERKYELKVRGVDLEFIAGRVAEVFGMEPEAVWKPGRYKQQVRARSLLCYWAVRELGETMTSLARRLGISTVAVSKSVARGETIASREGHSLLVS
jgi:REP element-mobilizing transposase RayT